MSVELGQILDQKYKLERLIGVGGMGRVFEATHVALGNSVAVKCLLPQLARVETLSARFMREARISAQLASPYVARVTDVGQLPDNTPYLVMELLEGELLQDYIERSGRLTAPRTLQIAMQVLKALETAHGMGVIHRDLKPENVFVLKPQSGEESASPHVKVLDFGIARLKLSSEFQALTQPGTSMGTPEYMAPEQAYSADQADERSDIYSVGVMLYEMLAGRLPAEGDTPLEIANKVISGSLVPLADAEPELPAALCDWVMRSLNRDPEERPQSAGTLREGLQALMAAGATKATEARGSSTRPGHAQSGVASDVAELAPSLAASSSPAADATRPGIVPELEEPARPVALKGPAAEEPRAQTRPAPVKPAPASQPVDPAPQSSERATGNPDPEARPGPSAAQPFPATEQMSVVSLPIGNSPPAARASLQPTAPDALPAAVERKAAEPPRGVNWVRTSLLGLAVCLAAATAAAYLYLQATDPGPPPALPRLPRPAGG